MEPRDTPLADIVQPLEERKSVMIPLHWRLQRTFILGHNIRNQMNLSLISLFL